jgi:hypothetical protein
MDPATNPDCNGKTSGQATLVFGNYLLKRRFGKAAIQVVEMTYQQILKGTAASRSPPPFAEILFT